MQARRPIPSTLQRNLLSTLLTDTETDLIQATILRIRALIPNSSSTISNITNHDPATAVLVTAKAIPLFQTNSMATNRYQAVVMDGNLLHKASSVKSQASLLERSTPSMPRRRFRNPSIWKTGAWKLIAVRSKCTTSERAKGHVLSIFS